MNKDGIPELLLNPGGITILTVKEHTLSLVGSSLYSSSVWSILTNGSVLSTRNGAAPTHINYDYITFDMTGNQTDVYFSVYKSDDNEDTGEYSFNDMDYYVFNNDTVTKADWDSLTRRYLTVPPAKIDWKPLSETVSTSEFSTVLSIF